MDHYYTIDAEAVAEFKDRGSKFLAYAYPFRDAAELKERIQALKKEHPKAVHHCFAYRLGTDGNTFRVNDDGEPSGTAGKPILGQIDSRELTDVLVVVVRYFGGTLLGVPGLIHAYKTVTSLVLQCIPAVKKVIEIPYTLQFNYTDMNEVMRLMRQFNCTILQNDMQLFCVLRAGIPRNHLDEVLAALSDLPAVEVSVA